jgi:hypothetical protein
MANDINPWQEICWQHDFDLSEAAASLRQPAHIPILDDDPATLYQSEVPGADAFAKAIMDSQPLVEIFGVEPSEALQLTRTRNNAHAEVAVLFKAKVDNMIVQAPLRKRAVAGILKQFKTNMAAKGYRCAASEPWDRLAAVMEQFVASSVALTI